MQTSTIQPILTLAPSGSPATSTPTQFPASTLSIPPSLPSSTRSSPVSSNEHTESDISDDEENSEDEFQEAEEYQGRLPTPHTQPAAAAAASSVPAAATFSVPLPEANIAPMQVTVNGVSEGLRGLVVSDSSNSVSSVLSSSEEASAVSSAAANGAGHSRNRSDSSQISVITANNTSSTQPTVTHVTTLRPVASGAQPTFVALPLSAPNVDLPQPAFHQDARNAPPQLRRQLTLEMLESPQHQQAVGKATPPHSAPPSPQRTAEGRHTLGLFHRLIHHLSPGGSPSASSHSTRDGDSSSGGQVQQQFASAAIKVKSKQKSSVNVLTGVHETQRLEMQHVGPIWAITLAPDGSYVATGGQDSVLRLWPLQPNSPHLSGAPIALSGHRSDIVDVSFAPSQFVLSASIDHTVRLWHPSKNAALSVFQHPDFVTAVHFNPLDDRTFATVCFDRKVRVWSVMDHRVTEWTKVSELCTACRYDRTGRYILVGTHVGTVAVIRAGGGEAGGGGGGLKYVQELNCRNRSGKYKKGKKVTGIDFFGHLMLVTTNDSRLRIFDMNDETDQFTLVCKLKGGRNESLQIKGKFNDDGTLVLCGSDDGQIAVWQVPPQVLQPASRRMQVAANQAQAEHNKPMAVIKVAAREQFHAMTGSVATCAQFLPRSLCHDAGVHHVIVAASSSGEVKLFEDRRV